MALEVRNVSVQYDGTGHRGRHKLHPQVLAVDNVSFSLADGDSLALLGPSGCGKSSLLRAIVGLEPLAGGQISFDGVDLINVPVHQRGFGLLFQDGQLFPHRNVGRNVSYGLEMQKDRKWLRPAKVSLDPSANPIAVAPNTGSEGVTANSRPGREPWNGRAAREQRVAEVLNLVGLAGYQSRPIDTLSGGERQRVALARALAPQPRLLLLDEPFSALDRNLRLRLVQEVRDILHQTSTTAITVTHDHDEAFTIANRVGIMQKGQLIATGTRDQLQTSPDPRVQEFLTASGQPPS